MNEKYFTKKKLQKGLEIIQEFVTDSILSNGKI